MPRLRAGRARAARLGPSVQSTVLDESDAPEDAAGIAQCTPPGAAATRAGRRSGSCTDAGLNARKTEDAEACASRDGYVYLVGSQFGKKAGRSAKRSWIARVSEESIERSLAGEQAELEIVRLKFGLHRAINDALAGVELLPVVRWAGRRTSRRPSRVDSSRPRAGTERIRPTDHPINVEAAEFRADGRLLLGLRYAVSADGHPLLVELENVDELFDDANAVPRCGNVWIIGDAGSVEAPAGSAGSTRMAAIGSTP